MRNKMVSDDFLYKYMPKAEEAMLAALPKREELNHIFSPEFERKMTRLIKQEKRSPFTRAFIHYTQRVAVISLLVISILFATTMSIDSARAKFFEIVTRIFNEYTSVTYNSFSSPKFDEFIPITPTHIPEGYKLAQTEESRGRVNLVYENDENDRIFYFTNLISSGGHLYNTEDTQLVKIEIAGQEATTYTNLGVTRIFWTDDDTYYSVSTTLGLKEAKKIAKSVITQIE